MRVRFFVKVPRLIDKHILAIVKVVRLIDKHRLTIVKVPILIEKHRLVIVKVPRLKDKHRLAIVKVSKGFRLVLSLVRFDIGYIYSVDVCYGYICQTTALCW